MSKAPRVIDPLARLIKITVFETEAKTLFPVSPKQRKIVKMAPAESYKSDSRLNLEDDVLDVEADAKNIVDDVGGVSGVAVVDVDDNDSVKKEDMEKKNSKTKMENFKYYTSLFLGTLSIVCIFAFLFLVPFVLDPVGCFASMFIRQNHRRLVVSIPRLSLPFCHLLGKVNDIGTILLPRVRVPSTPSMLLSFILFVLYLSCEKNENKQKRPGSAHKNQSMISLMVGHSVSKLYVTYRRMFP